MLKYIETGPGTGETACKPDMRIIESRLRRFYSCPMDEEAVWMQIKKVLKPAPVYRQSFYLVAYSAVVGGIIGFSLLVYYLLIKMPATPIKPFPL